MLLPGGTDAVVDITKLRDYVLNPSHPRGKHKARVFASALRIEQADAEFVRCRLLEAAAVGEVVPGENDEYGQRDTLDFELDKTGHRAMVRSAWVVLAGESFPLLTTCFVLSD